MRQKDRRPEEPFLTFVCRIRRPLPLELGDVRPTPRLKSKTPKGVIADCDYSVFTTIKESGIVLSSDTPITGRLINASLSTAGDAPAFVRGLDQKAILTHTFDHAISDTVTQEEFFTRHARRLVQTGFQGRSGTILAYGPAGAGKTHTVRGRPDSERGCVPRAVQELFSLIELAREGKTDKKYSVTLSVYHIYGERIVDLLETTDSAQGELAVTMLPQEQAVSRDERTISGLSEHQLRSAAGIFKLLERAETLRKIQASNFQDRDISSHAHTIVLIRIYTSAKGPRQLWSQLQFVELAGSDHTEWENDNCFEELSVRLLKHSLGDSGESKDQLEKCLDLSMRTRSPLLLVCCVPPCDKNVKPARAALEYVCRIRSCILSSLYAKPKKSSPAPVQESPAPLVSALESSLSSRPEFAQTLPNIVVREEASPELLQTLPAMSQTVRDPHEAQFEEDLQRVKLRVSQEQQRSEEKASRGHSLTSRHDEERETDEIADVAPRSCRGSARGNNRSSPPRVEPRAEEMRSPEFVPPPAVTLSEEARRIVDKYASGEKESPESAGNTRKLGEELRKKIEQVEAKTKDIAKTIKKAIACSPKRAEAAAEELKETYESRTLELQSRLEAAEEELAKRDTLIEKQEKRTEKLVAQKEQDMRALVEQVCSMKDTLDHSDKAMATLTEEKSQLEKAVADLTQRQRENEAEKAQNSLASEKAVAELKDRLREKKQAIVSLEAEKVEMGKEIAGLRQELEAKGGCEKSAEGTRVQLEESKLHLASAQQRIEHLVSKKNKYKELERARQAQIDDLKEKVRTLEAAAGQTEAKRSGEAQTWKERAEAVRREEEAARKQCEMLTAQLQEYKKNLDDKHEETVRLKQEIREKEAEIAKMREEFENEKNQVVSAQQEKAETFASQLKTAEEAAQTLGREKRELQVRIEQIEKSCSDLRNQKEKLVATCSQRGEGEKSAAERCLALEAECQALRDKNLDLLVAAEDAKKKAGESEDARDSYKEQYLNLKKLNGEMRKRLESIEQDMQMLMRQREVETFENQKREMAQRYKEQSRLETMREVHDKISQFKTERTFRGESPPLALQSKKKA